MRPGHVTLVAALALSLAPALAAAQSVTVLYDDRVVSVERTLADPNDLWVVPEDLPRVNGFELKPERLSRRALCPGPPGPRQRDVRDTRRTAVVQRHGAGA